MGRRDTDGGHCEAAYRLDCPRPGGERVFTLCRGESSMFGEVTMPISLDCVAETMALDGEWWRRAEGWRVELYYPEGWRQARAVA